MHGRISRLVIQTSWPDDMLHYATLPKCRFPLATLRAGGDIFLLLFFCRTGLWHSRWILQADMFSRE
jgi:hypothetical protein